jgi:hypothetical protein
MAVRIPSGNSCGGRNTGQLHNVERRHGVPAQEELLPLPWEEAPAELSVDVFFSAHVVYSLARIEDFLLFLERVAQRWAAVVLFGGPAESRVNGVWQAVYAEVRLSNPGLQQLLPVLWSLDRYPDVTMLDVPPWPLGKPERARRSLRRRLHVVPGSDADKRLEAAMNTLLLDWGMASSGQETGGL